MYKFFSWREFRHQWWGMPIWCALILIPLASCMSPMIDLPDGRNYLMYLPLAACVALLMVFDWRAFPGIALTLFLRYDARIGAEMGLFFTLVYLAALALTWGGYRLQVRTRWSASFGFGRISLPRFIWTVIVLSACFTIFLQIIIELGWLPAYLGMVSQNYFTLRTLLNLQSIILGTTLAAPIFYIAIRIFRKPTYIRVVLMRIRCQRAESVTLTEIILWSILTIAMMLLLCVPNVSESFEKILLNDYALTLLLPVMMFAAMRYGYHFISIIWFTSLITLFFNYRSFVSELSVVDNLLFISALMVVFTQCLLLMSAISSRQRMLMHKINTAALRDPVLGLPNLRAFSRDLARYPRSLVCFIRVSEMDVLSRNYGMQLRIQFKQQLALALKPNLSADENIYHLPGYDLVLRLNCYENEARLEQLQQYLNDFRLIWNGLPVHPNIGLSYCVVHPPVQHLPILLGELSGIAEISLTTGVPESNRSNHNQVHEIIKTKVVLLHNIQRSLDENSFILMAQPIVGVRGDSYYEILLRMKNELGETIMPNDFFPVVHEFGLSYQVDMWVLEHTLKFMDENRESLPSLRFAINFLPSTLCRPMFSREFKKLMQTYGIEPYQIVIELTESHLLQDLGYADKTMRELRNFGCRVAIDDFGTGYATYDRLKAIEADILKIDGSFVRNMLTNQLDAYIISSICQVARMKRMSIVAEYVETQEQMEALRAQGVDYMQGYLVGKPQPLTQLLMLPAIN